jgi:HTH-type transcriptional regulator/antitoxin HigA
MATLTETAYGKLLSKVRPRVIRTEAENERALAELEALDNLEEMERPLTREEAELAELLTVLIQQFEEARYPLGHAAPIDALRNLMEVRGLRQRDLIPVFGASSVVSNVLNGKRSISKAHARKLAEFFHVPASLFI